MDNASIALTVSEETKLREYEVVIERGVRTFVEVGCALAAIRDGRLYRAEHGTFEEYCRDRWGMVASRARQLIASAEVVGEITSVTNVTLLPSAESQVRPLVRLEPAEQIAAWQEAVDTAPNGKVTAAHVAEVVERRTGVAPHVTHNSGENEWYTPAEYIAAARAVMGAIDLDPASSEAANRTVDAATYYTAQDDGLTRSWQGRVWMNPPYSQPLIGLFCNALRWAIETGQVTEAISLTNNATETAWFADLLANAAAVCFVRSRIKFVDRDGNPSGAPLQGQAIVYSGPNVDAFAQYFGAFGAVLYAR